MALPLDGANKGKNGSSFGRWNRAHWKVVTAVVLVVVLLVLAIVSSIASLIMVLMEDDDNEGLYTETRLYVKAMTGNYMPGTKSVVNPTNKTEKPSPIEQLSVTLKPDPATFKSLSNDKTKEDAASIQFDPTDTNGLSYIVINSGGLGKLTMSTGNDAYYGIGADGKPTQHYKIIATGRMTFYDSYSYKGASDTGGTNYNLDNSSPCNAGFSDGSPLSKQKSSGSDTWHVIGFPSNADGGGNKVNSEYYTCKDHRQDNPPLLYSWSPNASSYGACLGLDTNGPGGATSIADQYFPYNKYYGKYGINKHSADDFGGSSKGGRKPMAHPEDFDMYLKNIGVANTKKARSIWDGHGNILYMLDDSGDKVNGKTRSKYLHSLTKHGKAWPTNMTGGATGTDSTPSDSDDYHKYFVESKLTDVGKEKYGAGKYNNIMPHSKKLEDIEAGTKSDPFYVNFGSTNSWTLMFWTEEVQVGAEGDDLAGTTDYLAWAKKLADNPKVGYSLGSNHGSTFKSNSDVDCSSLVFWSLKKTGHLPKETSCFSTPNEPNVLLKNGFTEIHSLNDLKPGDILWKNGHTEIYVGGKAYSLGAHQNLDGHSGKGGGGGHADSTAKTEVGYASGKQSFARAFRAPS